MAVKTITIDMEAYEALAREKKAGESFSQTIKRLLRGKKTAANLLRHVSAIRLGDEALGAIDRTIESRGESYPATGSLDNVG